MNIDYFYVLANLAVKKMFLKVMGKTELTVFEMTVHFYVMFFSFLVPEFCIGLNSVQFCFVLWRVVDMCHLLLKVLLNSKNVITFWSMVALFFFAPLKSFSKAKMAFTRFSHNCAKHANCLGTRKAGVPNSLY